MLGSEKTQTKYTLKYTVTKDRAAQRAPLEQRMIRALMGAYPTRPGWRFTKVSSF